MAVSSFVRGLRQREVFTEYISSIVPTIFTGQDVSKQDCSKGGKVRKEIRSSYNSREGTKIKNLHFMLNFATAMVIYFIYNFNVL
jgi:hypothetical protein